MKINNIVLGLIALFVGTLLSAGTAWALPGFFAQGGNSFAETATLGTTDNFDLKIVTNNTERARITSAGAATFAGSLSVTGVTTLSGGATIACTACVTDTNISNALTGKTYNNLALTSSSDGFSITGGATSRTLAVSNSDISLNQNLLTSSSPSFSGLALTGPLTASSSAGISGQVLMSNGSSSSPSWQTLAPSKSSARVRKTSGDFSTTTASNFVDIDDASITMTTGASRVLLTFTSAWKSTGANGPGLVLDLVIDGVSVGGTNGIMQDESGVSANVFHALSFSYLTDILTAGSHTFKLQTKAPGGGIAITISSGSTIPMVFGAVEI